MQQSCEAEFTAEQQPVEFVELFLFESASLGFRAGCFGWVCDAGPCDELGVFVRAEISAGVKLVFFRSERTGIDFDADPVFRFPEFGSGCGIEEIRGDILWPFVRIIVIQIGAVLGAGPPARELCVFVWRCSCDWQTKRAVIGWGCRVLFGRGVLVAQKLEGRN